MWQSHVEIEGYLVVYFDHIAAFQALYRWTYIKDEAHTCFMNLLGIYTSTKHMSPTLNESSAVWRFKHGNVIKIYSGIIYMGQSNIGL